MTFDVVEDDLEKVVLAPSKVSVLHSDLEIDIHSLLTAMVRDWQNMSRIRQRFPELADAVTTHADAVRGEVNTSRIRTTADEVVRLKAKRFGPSNAGSALTLLGAEALPTVAAEDDTGREGRLLVRLHTYKERDRGLSRRARAYYKERGGGRLTCQACGVAPSETYGESGERAMEAHHTVPIEELQPDTEVRIEDMAMLCANCHRVAHSRKPCLTVDELRNLIGSM